MSVTSDVARPLLFLHRDGKLLPSPREWEAATIVLPGIDTQDWLDAKLYRQQVEIPLHQEKMADGIRVCAAWERAGAGTWQVRIHAGGAEAIHTIRVAPAKLTSTALAALVRDLEERLPASVVMALDKLGAFGRLRWDPPGVVTRAQELERLRHAIEGDAELPGVATMLRQIGTAPHHILANEDRWTRLDAARRPPPALLAAALSRPGNWLPDGLPTWVIDRRTETSFDTYENRLVRALVEKMDRRLRGLERAATRDAGFAESNSPTLARLRETLRVGRCAVPFLDDVGSLRTAPDRLTQVLLRRPPYRLALQHYLRLQQAPRIRLDHPAMDSPFDNVPRLYELWGTLVVLTELLEVAKRTGWHVTCQHLTTPDAIAPLVRVFKEQRLLELRRGAATASLHVQRGFPEHDPQLRSVSFEQRPDLVLEVCKGDGERALYLFDPKYKLAGSEAGVAGPAKADIDKMHAYRDAIRAAAGRRVVCSASILYPGPTRQFQDEGIAAIGLVPGLAQPLLRGQLARALGEPVSPPMPACLPPASSQR